jgi:hypothetical protein
LSKAHTNVSGDLRGSKNDRQREENLRHRIRGPVRSVLNRGREDHLITSIIRLSAVSSACLTDQ